MANALLSTVNAARQRQPMCIECEKSLPNQIVFDKIEKIIRFMQDEQNGLPVKTAKSFMSKIPSVFTGTDLIQWMMRNLKLEDQQEAMHLANLIASHGYIFPIEDHTLSIKNDCTFYRFQTPCLWPSNNSDPENTDYAVYLCKRTMQGKTRLELADYEAENLARLQKMFSRKWEFIFMQAESQAKVDKKRDKLERKVLDSQERAFWDVYRPVPGCVNTTELDIKKACRLSKSAKRCGECRKVASALQSSTTSTAGNSNNDIGKISNNNNNNNSSGGSSSSSIVSSSKLSPTITISKTVQIPEHSLSTSRTANAQVQQQATIERLNPAEPPGDILDKIGEFSIAEQKTSDEKVATERLTPDQREEDDNKGGEEETALRIINNDMTTTTTSDIGKHIETTNSRSSREQKAEATSSQLMSEKKSGEQVAGADKQQLGSAGHQHHQHQQHQHQHQHHRQHHHHHHHHPHPHQHPHQHAHHRHHHHHHHHHQHHQHHLRQCPRHEQQIQLQPVATSSAAQTTATSDNNTGDSNNSGQLSKPAESMLTAVLATSSARKVGVGENSGSNNKEKSSQSDQHSRHERQLCAQKRSVGSVDRLASLVPAAPSIQARRKSECNPHVLSSMIESPVWSEQHSIPRDLSGHEVDEKSYTSSARVSTAMKTAISNSSARPSSACCSLSSLEKPSGSLQAEMEATTSSGQQQHRASQMVRKSSLNLGGLASSSADKLQQSSIGRAGVGQQSAECSRKVQSSSSSTMSSEQRLKLTGQLAMSAASGSSGRATADSIGAAGSCSVAADRQNIGELERELEALKVRLDGRIGGVKMSKVTQSYLSYFKQWAEYDPFIAQPIPSNPWISDSTDLWDSERQTKDVHCRRVRRWAFSLKELLSDPAGREQFHRFLEKEFSAENLKFWDAVQDLKRVHSRDVGRRVEAIWTEYLAPDANCPINIDSKSYETSKKNMAKNKNNRCIFDEAAGHVYQLMKNDSYPRYLRSDMYKDYKEASEKKRTNQQAFDVFKPQITTLKHKFNF